VVPVRAPVEPAARLTVTLSVINTAAAVWFLVLGAEKAEILRRIQQGEKDVTAALVRPEGGALIWWVDAPAGAFLSEREPRQRR
jgi:6-phosphogluconolactonase